MRHPGSLWIEPEDREAPTPGDVEIGKGSIRLRVGETVVAEWDAALLRVVPAGDDSFRLESGADTILFSPLDVEAFRTETSAIAFRSRLSPATPSQLSQTPAAPPPPAVGPPMAPPPQVVGPPAAMKNPGVAAVLSFFWAGLGQIYNGEIGKGIAIMIVQAINVVLAFVVIGFVTGLGVLVWAVFDAYQVAERHNAALASRTVG